MDPYRFDEWTKSLVSGTSRRTFLGGLLKAGAVALGLAASAQAARADDDDDDNDDDRPQNTEAKCQRILERCRQRNSFKQCSKCVEQAAAAGCAVPAGVNPCPCSSDTYCADKSGCTLDICSSNRCYNVPIEDTCVECRNNRQCPNGGKCCSGRCCPAGSTCQTSAEGIGLCCQTCGDGTTCCQQINYAGNPNGPRDYSTLLQGCVGQEGANFNPPLPTGCCNGAGGSYEVDASGNPVFNENGSARLICFAPIRSLP